MEPRFLGVNQRRVEEKLREKECRGRLGLRREEKTVFSAVYNTENQNLSNPFLNNYNLALHKKGKCIRVSNELRKQ